MSTGIGLSSFTVQNVLSGVRATLGSSNSSNLSNDQILAKLNNVWQFYIPLDFVHFTLTSVWSFMTVAGVDRYIFPQQNASNIIGDVNLNNTPLILYDSNQSFFSNYVGTLQNYIITVAETAASTFSLQLGREIARGYTNILGVPVPSVFINAVGVDKSEQSLYDFGTGVLTDAAGVGSGTIDYYTGAVTVNFAVDVEGPIYATFDNSSWTRPSRCLFYDNVLTLRNIPNQPYQVTAQVQYIPAPFTSVNDVLPVPNLFLYFQYKTALLISQSINDQVRVEAIAPLAQEAIEGFNRITMRQSDNRRRSNEFYKVDNSGLGLYPFVINPYGPSISTV